MREPSSTTTKLEHKAPASQAGGIYPGWYAVGLGFLLQIFASGPIYYAYGNYSAAFEQEFQAPRTLINLAYSLVVLVGAVGSAPVGWLADRWPIRRLALIGVVGTSIGLGLVGATTAMWQIVLLFGTLIAAADIFIGNVTSNYLVSRWFERRRGLALGLSIIGASVAAMVFPPLTSGLIDAVGWRTTFMIYGLAMLSLLLPVWWFATVPATIPEAERKLRPAVSPARKVLGFRALAAVPAFWIISACCGTMIGVNGAMMISLVPYAVGRGFSSLEGAALVSMIGGGALVGKLAFGLVADHVDLRWAQRLGLTFMAAAMGLLMLEGGYRLLALAAIVFGLGLGGMMPVWAALVSHIFGLASCGSALGGTRAAMTPLAMACPMLAGWAFDRTGDYRMAWQIFLVLLLTAVALTFVRKDWARPVAD
jgi:MFS family permease